jgi:hypothetical protein
MKATFHGVTLNESVVCDRHVDFQAAFLTPGRCCRDGSGSTIGGRGHNSATAAWERCRTHTNSLVNGLCSPVVCPITPQPNYAPPAISPLTVLPEPSRPRYIRLEFHLNRLFKLVCEHLLLKYGRGLHVVDCASMNER